MRCGFSGKLVTQWHFNTQGKREQWDFAQERGIEAVEGIDSRGLGRKKLHFNSNSGAQAINLAYLYGATQIILLGYNMQPVAGQRHFFGDHPETLHNGNYFEYAKRFTRLADDLRDEGVDVINCTKDSALTQFRFAELDDVI